MNHAIRRISALALSALTLAAAFSGCGKSVDAVNQGEVQTLFDLESKVFIPDVNMMVSTDGIYSFSLFASRFTSIYNQILENEPKCILTLASEDEREEDKTPYFGYDAYRYDLKTYGASPDSPTLTLYTPRSNSSIYEMKMTFDAENYTEEYYNIYKQMCLCTFRIMLPSCPDSELTDLFDALYNSAMDNDYSDEYQRPPQSLFRSKNAGLFSYYDNGTINISLLPLDDLFFDSIVGSEVHIYDISPKKSYDSANSDED